MFAWKYELTRKEVRLIERWCHGDTDANAATTVGMSKHQIEQTKTKVCAATEAPNVKMVCTIAGQFGIGPEA